MPVPIASALLGAALRVGIREIERRAAARITVAFRRRALLKIAETIGKKTLEMSREARKAENQSAENALKIARELSSGRFSSAQLRLLGHPYATRAPHPPQDSAIINRQSGQFYRGWRVIAPRLSGGQLTTRLVNESPNVLRLTRGTARMIARPILTRIRERAEPRRRALYRAAIRRTLSR